MTFETTLNRHVFVFYVENIFADGEISSTMGDASMPGAVVLLSMQLKEKFAA